MSLPQTPDPVQREIEAIKAEAEAQRRKRIEDAQHDAKKLADEQTQALQQLGRRSAVIAKSEAVMELRAQKGRTLETLMEQLKEKVFVLLDRRWRQDFEALASETIVAAAKRLGVGDVILSFPPSYKDLFAEHEKEIRQYLSERAVMLSSVSFDLGCRGGVLVTRPDGRRQSTESFEENFRRIEDDVRTELAKRTGYGE